MDNENETVYTVEDLNKLYRAGGPSEAEMAKFMARRSKEYEQLLGVYQDTPDFGRVVGDPHFMGMSRNGKGEWVDAFRVDVCVDETNGKWERRVVPFEFIFFKEDFIERFNQAKPAVAEFDILLVEDKSV